MIRFRLPEGIDATQVASATGEEPRLSGDIVTVPSRDPQRDLYALLGWARQRDLELVDLEVRRPSLEDVFLDLTSQREEAAVQ